MRFKDKPKEPERPQYQLCCNKCKSATRQLFSLRSYGKELVRQKRITKKQLKDMHGYYCRYCLAEISKGGNQ